MRNYTLRVRRFDPQGHVRAWDEFRVEMEPFERLLDGLIRIKDAVDGSLTFRRSCAHGICGSCGMKVNGRNALACQSIMRDMPGKITIEPLPAFPVIKDLVVDLGPFYGKDREVLPYLINEEPAPERERLQMPEEQLRLLQAISCIMCACCTSSCPIYRADKDYLGPAALLKAARFVLDSRDRAHAERLGRTTGRGGIFRCHSVYNCVEVCPKGIDVAGYISRLKRRSVLGLLKKP
jgi:succinate dehydrogenase / fumarate reductase iron-sulfur subunit